MRQKMNTKNKIWLIIMMACSSMLLAVSVYGLVGFRALSIRSARACPRKEIKLEKLTSFYQSTNNVRALENLIQAEESESRVVPCLAEKGFTAMIWHSIIVLILFLTAMQLWRSSGK